MVRRQMSPEEGQTQHEGMGLQAEVLPLSFSYTSLGQRTLYWRTSSECSLAKGPSPLQCDASQAGSAGLLASTSKPLRVRMAYMQSIG